MYNSGQKSKKIENYADCYKQILAFDSPALFVWQLHKWSNNLKFQF